TCSLAVSAPSANCRGRRYFCLPAFPFLIPVLYDRSRTFGMSRMKRFADLTEQEILALAISNEEEDSRIYQEFAQGLREQFPSSAEMFDGMAAEEVGHRTRLFDLYRRKFGEHLPLIRRQD